MHRIISRVLTRAIIPVVLATNMSAVEGQTLYPRVITDGENSTMDYGSLGNQSAPVGGGRVVVTGVGEDAVFHHLDEQYVQRGRDGERPVTAGSGESATVVWVPLEASRTSVAQVGQDGSLPATPGASLLPGRLAAAR